MAQNLPENSHTAAERMPFILALKMLEVRPEFPSPLIHVVNICFMPSAGDVEINIELSEIIAKQQDPEGDTHVQHAEKLAETRGITVSM